MAPKKKTKKKMAKKSTAKNYKKSTKKAAAKKGGNKKGGNKKSKFAELIISKSRTKNAVYSCNVSGDFYGALDSYVRVAIANAEARASANGRKTLRPQDL
ncbi:MAG: hypothetical protein COB96_05210 [Planctomycetota bacterium]|nr:MAG: hypothetical protein COB96_05210 [Planctomycetota bacterium]